MLNPAADYHELNAGAQRDEPKSLNAPALTWHVAFWIRKNPNDPDDATNSRERVKKQLDTFILRLCDSLMHDSRNIIDDITVSQCINTNVLLFSSVVDRTSFTVLQQPHLTWREREIINSGISYVSIAFTWRKIRISMRVELHTEYFSITTFAELTRAKQPYSELAALDSKIDQLLVYARNNDPYSADDSTLIALRRYFFYDFWKSYRDELISFYTNVVELLNEQNENNIFNESVFGDFRGMILSEKTVKFRDYDFFFSENSQRAPSWGVEAKKRFERLLDIRRQRRGHPYECAVNYVLDGYGLYMSALGPQVPEMNVERRIPVEYIVYAHQRDPFDHNKTIVNQLQLGRLVTQIHLLGTLRLAALKDIIALHEVGRDIGALAGLIQTARQAHS